MHKNWLTTFGHILRMRNCGSARYLFLARATCYLVRAMTTIARAMPYSSAGTLEIAIYDWKWRAMTTHFK